jgi:steroid 5-alpha reductase family enzyme
MSLAELALDAAIALISLAVVMSAGWTIQRQTGNSGWIDAVWTFGVGAPLMAAAIVGEALADSELARFKADPANRGAIEDDWIVQS